MTLPDDQRSIRGMNRMPKENLIYLAKNNMDTSIRTRYKYLAPLSRYLQHQKSRRLSEAGN